MMTIAQLLIQIRVAGAEAIPDWVLGGAFWLLAAPEGHAAQPQAWYQPNDTHIPVVDALTQKAKISPQSASPTFEGQANITHYLLLPSYEWGIPETYLEAIWPYIKKYQPTVGFSIREAAQAKRITVIGSENEYPEANLRSLRAQGRIVERIAEDGTNLAILISKLM